MGKENLEELPLRRILGIEFFKTFYSLYDNSQLFFARYELTSQQYNVLKILHESEKPISTSSILEQMVEKNAGVSRLVDRLVKKGFIEKKVNEEDKRLIDVFLTQNGKLKCELVTKNINDVDLIFSNLSDEDAEDLLRLLLKVR